MGSTKILKRADQILEAYDYVIAGGGTAGLTVGDRLSADGKSKLYCLLHDSQLTRSQILFW